MRSAKSQHTKFMQQGLAVFLLHGMMFTAHAPRELKQELCRQCLRSFWNRLVPDPANDQDTMGQTLLTKRVCISLSKEGVAFVSVSHSDGGVDSVPVTHSKRGVSTVFVSHSKGGVDSVSVRHSAEGMAFVSVNHREGGVAFVSVSHS